MVKTYIRFGVQKKKTFLKDIADIYDGIVLPGNILLYQYKATPSVIYMTRKDFFIDPMTYLFGEDFNKLKKDESSFKPSFKKLIVGHGLTPETVFNMMPERLIENLLNNDDFSKKFLESVMAFQYENVEKAKVFIEKIDESLLDDPLPCLRPQFLTLPYLMIRTENYKKIFAITKKFISYANCSNYSNYPRCILLSFTKSSIKDDNIRNSFINLANDPSFTSVAIWINDFSEVKDAKSELISSFIDLVKKIEDKKIHILHGGYFSLLLKHFGVSSVSHGIGYGESRIGITSAKKGGPPPIRYYISELRRFYTLDKAEEILQAFPDFICSCPPCRRVIGGVAKNVIEYSNEEGLADLHYMYVRHKEKESINDSTLQDVLDDLKMIMDTYSGEQLLKIEHIIEWHNQLSRYHHHDN